MQFSLFYTRLNHKYVYYYAQMLAIIDSPRFLYLRYSELFLKYENL